MIFISREGELLSFLFGEKTSDLFGCREVPRFKRVPPGWSPAIIDPAFRSPDSRVHIIGFLLLSVATQANSLANPPREFIGGVPGFGESLSVTVAKMSDVAEELE